MNEFETKLLEELKQIKRILGELAINAGVLANVKESNTRSLYEKCYRYLQTVVQNGLDTFAPTTPKGISEEEDAGRIQVTKDNPDKLFFDIGYDDESLADFKQCIKDAIYYYGDYKSGYGSHGKKVDEKEIIEQIFAHVDSLDTKIAVVAMLDKYGVKYSRY